MENIFASDITSHNTYKSRRQLVKQLLGIGLLGSAGKVLPSHSATQLQDALTPKHKITHYNNYYEFSTNKEVIHILAKSLKLAPWTLTISGEVEKTITLDLDQIRHFQQEERIYRLRCVEGWSMVVPWLGIPLHKILSLAKPLSSANYVKFIGTLRPEEMINQRHPVLPWPYTEGLRIDEAVHPLTLLVTGLYGEELPAQNGAPLRLAVPWKYAFKSIKAIQKIELCREQPNTSWHSTAPSEYGFYANVNPSIAHPRWSQKREVRIGELKKRATLPLNGYAEQVASLYQNMNSQQLY